ncbi:MAG: MarR family winged helix-turn-helix transcriptional regulator [Clostridiales bacterium]|nr:MarR family winged helix-turn-helix transcriptional regulator [Clostridiales bacterium]MDO4350272.1 MarR family winged helix-turn-helix transcriptional regulator [Eubacteriales bacterium]MDY4009100.1 MarR family winged helix-turn-helix transcriptional regulator [Candidatus Limiplasma sp.]
MEGLAASFVRIARLYFDCVSVQMGEAERVHPRQAPILGMLLHNEGMSQAQLARALNVTPATVAVSVARLERLGCLCRERNAHNQRANVLALTPAGRAKAQQLLEAMEAVKIAAFDGFSQEELAQLGGYCARMTQNLRGRYQPGEEK